MSCPRRYFLQYVERAEPAFRSAALALGTAWHETIGVWLTSEATSPELIERLRTALRQQFAAPGPPVLFDDEDQTEEAFVARASSMLTAFVQTVPKPRAVLAVELPFRLELDHPDSGEVLGIPVIGAIDALVGEVGCSSVWELKTAAKRWSADQLELDQQMTLYGRVARLEGHERARLKVLVTTKSRAPMVQVADVERSLADEDELVDTFFKVERGVAAGVDHRVRSWQCRTCAFAGACR